MNEEHEEPTPEEVITAVFDAVPAPAGPAEEQYLTLPPIAEPPQARLGCGAQVALAVALAMSLLALIVSSVLLISLARAGSATAAVLDRTIGQLEGVCGASSKPVVFPFSQTIHFKGNFALPEGLVIPFKGTIPIDTNFPLKIGALPGSPTFVIPIHTSVTVDTKVPVPGGISIPIDTQIPINQEIPLDLCGSGGPAKQFLEGTIKDLKAVRSSMSFP
jgi:hypothetical protein